MVFNELYPAAVTRRERRPSLVWLKSEHIHTRREWSPWPLAELGRFVPPQSARKPALDAVDKIDEIPQEVAAGGKK